jgi:hypothetical protein
MKPFRLRAGRPAIMVFGLFSLLLATAGCGSGFKTVPVSGKLFVDGKPLTGADATVLFHPDASKGNTLQIDFAGNADDDGNYTLYHGNGDKGVAPGWYKVAVVAIQPMVPRSADKKTKVRMPGKPVRITLIDNKYSVPASSGIEIEVVGKPSPGAYDLNLTPPANKQPPN